MTAVAHLTPDQTYLEHKASAMVHAVAIVYQRDPDMLSAAGDLLIGIKTGLLPVDVLMHLANSLPFVMQCVRWTAVNIDRPWGDDSYLCAKI